MLTGPELTGKGQTDQDHFHLFLTVDSVESEGRCLLDDVLMSMHAFSLDGQTRPNYVFVNKQKLKVRCTLLSREGWVEEGGGYQTNH